MAQGIHATEHRYPRVQNGILWIRTPQILPEPHNLKIATETEQTPADRPVLDTYPKLPCTPGSKSTNSQIVRDLTRWERASRFRVPKNEDFDQPIDLTR